MVLVRVTRRVKMTVSSYLLNIVLILNLFLLTGCSLNEQCEKGDCAGSLEPPENKYSEAANSKFRHMEEELAKTASYEPCPQSNNCSCHLPTLIKDLQPFKHGITKQMIESVKKKGTKYQIIDNRLYRQKECLFPARCSGIEYFLLELVAGGGQYDTELIVNTRDWPQLNRVWGSPLAPVFSFSKTSDYWDIMYPAWSFWEGGPAIKLYPSGLGRWAQHRINIKKAAKEHPWDKKKPMAFFRGSRTSDERDPIVLLSRSRPDLVDAKYTKNQAWKSDADTLYQPPAEEVPLEDHCKFRYLFNYRGVAASFRFKHLFLCKSLVFHIGEDWLEFFYPSLIPWYHYIPVSPKATQEDIKTLIEYFREHDDVARRIAERGYQHISDNLRIFDIKNYWKELLNQYSSLLNFQVERDMDLIEIVAKK